MKAEHRKELETNALADRVGRAVQGMKQVPRKRTFVWLLAGAVLLVVVYWFYARSQIKREENALNWFLVADGKGEYLQQVLTSNPDSNQAKAIRFENDFLQLQQSMRFLASEPKVVLSNLDELENIYREMAKRCQDDKVLLPEALFAVAVIEETRMIKRDRDEGEQWKVALAAYKEVADKHPDSAFGKEARKRVAVLNDEKQRDELLKVYQDLRIAFVPPDDFLAVPPADPIPNLKTKPAPPKTPVLP
jgi:hypothetical protein